ncbi:MAG: hypothetical protein H7X79_06730 [Sporomusaceae bacterium]|nr:hypothetical protein [Sporomusaceae bacterium]
MNQSELDFKQYLLVQVVKALAGLSKEFQFEDITASILRDIKGTLLDNNTKFPVCDSILADREYMLVQEIVWNLIRDGILTPGANRDHLSWPWLRITNEKKFNDLALECKVTTI